MNRPLLAMFSLVFATFCAHAGWTASKAEESATSAALRGFGVCSIARCSATDGTHTVAGILFKSESPEKAECVIGKFLHDLALSHGVERRTAGRHTYFVTPGGFAFAGGWTQNDAVLLGGPEGSLLAALDGLQDNETTVASGRFPEYMLRFGWGTYGMGGFDNMFDWMRLDGTPNAKDPAEDFNFHLAMDDGTAGPMHFDNWLDPASFDNSDGILGHPEVWWKARLAEKLGIPTSFRVYGAAGGYDWTQRRFPEYMNQPADFMVNGWLRYHDTAPHFSWYQPDIHKYVARTVMDAMAKLKTPATRGWMHPHGELVHQPWYDMHQDVSPAAHKSWHDFLAAHGVTPESAAELYAAEPGAFRSWDDVPLPEFATFSGLPGLVLDLAGTWRERRERGIGPVPADFWKTPPEERDAGIRERWYLPETDLSDWGSIDMPGNPEFIPRLYPELLGWNVDGSMASHWYRREFSWDPALAPDGRRVWLYFFPMSDSVVHSPAAGSRRHRLFLNGREAGGIGTWGALDVTDALRAGPNTLVLQLHGCWWRGRVFLSTEEPRTYPGLLGGRDRLWTLWDAWRRESKFDAWRTILDGMRQVDPEAPVKFMAPEGFGTPLTHRLCLDWGGYPHFTGEGIWFYPWYKRYGKLYGIPATSELAGPSGSVNDLRTSTLRVFLAGLDGHEPVFLTQMYSRRPELRDWWLSHRNVLRRIGTYDIDGPQILLYRRSGASGEFPQPWPLPAGADTHRVATVWDWDIGRGSLQSLGQSPLYIDDDGLRDGKLDGHSLLFDCGNESIPPERLADLRAWIERGGTFVTFPFTGRAGGDAPWPIADLTGCAVLRERPLGGEVRFADKPAILAVYAGRAFRDEGLVIDWQGDNHTAYSVELAPGPGVETVATYENGAAAVAVRPLGRGRVVAFGSAFWRDAADRMGIWWPGAGEREFLARLLADVGFPRPCCETDDPLVWAQPYRSNNGLDAVAVLCDFNAEGTREVAVTLRPGARPRSVVVHTPGKSESVPCDWDEAAGEARLRLTLAAQEVAIVEAETHGPADAIAHWWDRQQELWRPTETPSIDFAPYREGKWADPTLDLAEDARFTTEPPADGWDSDAAFDDSAWTPAPLSVPFFWGAAPGAPVWYRKTFDLGPEWTAADTVTLVAGQWEQGGKLYLTPSRMVLNGTELHGFQTGHYDTFEVARLLRPAGNVLAIEMQAGEKYAGVVGKVYLYRREKPVGSLDLSGEWTGTGGKALAVTGEATLACATRTVDIPAEWEGRRRVRLWMTASRNAPIGVRVNGHLVRRHHHRFGETDDLDITAHLRFGASNTLTLVATPDGDYDEHSVALDECRLDLFDID